MPLETFELWKTPLIDPAEDGHHGLLIEASAGTGKTFSIEHIVVRLLCDVEHNDFTPEKLLVVTFTKAATAELNLRLKATLAEACRAIQEALFELKANPSLRDDPQQCTVAVLNKLKSFPLLANLDGRDVPLTLERLEAIHARAAAALRDFDQATITTIHGFCEKMLGMHPLSGLSPSVVECVENDRRLCEKAVYEAKSACYAADVPPSPECMKAIEAADLPERLSYLMSNPGISDEMLTTLPEDEGPQTDREIILCMARILADARRRLTLDKRMNGIRTLDDILLDMRDAVRQPAFANAVRDAYRCVLIDEFQDTDDCQFEIFDTLFMRGLDQAKDARARTLVFVGDPKQAIYSFRGADIDAYRNARECVARIYRLPKNFRTQPRLLEILNTLFAPAPASSECSEDRVTLENYQKVESSDITLAVHGPDHALRPALTVSICDKKKTTKEEIILQMKADILSRLSTDIIGRPGLDSALKPSDIAILVRTHKEAEDIRTIFGADLRTNQEYAVSVYATRPARDALALLRALAQPHDEKRFLAAMTCEFSGLSAADLATDPANPGAVLEIRTKGRLSLQTFMQQLETDGFLYALDSYLENAGYIERMLAAKNGMLHLTALRMLAPRLDADWRRSKSVEVIASHLAARILESEDGEPKEEDCLPPFEEGEAVTLMTMHKSKGLEFPIVYIPFADKPISFKPEHTPRKYLLKHYPLETARWFGPNLRSADGDRITEAAEDYKRAYLEEEMRLLYVALTRAKCELVIGLTRDNAGKTGPWHAFFSESMNAPDESIEFWRSPAGTPSQLDPYASKVEALRTFGEDKVRIVEWSSDNVDDDARICSNEAEDCGSCSAIHADEGLSAPRRQTVFTSSFTDITRKTKFGFVHQIEPSLPIESREDDEASDSDTMPAVMQDESLTDKSSALGFPYPFGANAGDALHQMLEAIDFESLEVLPAFKDEGETLDKLADAKLMTKCPELSADDRQKAIDWVVRMVRTLVRTPLAMPGEAPICLADISAQSRRSEMDFMLSLPAGLTASKLNAALSGYRDDYAFMDESQPLNLTGYLNGSIDLVFTRNGKWWIVDWKSNKIAASPTDAVTPDMVKNEIASHRYSLQYILYLLAFRRFLHARMTKAGMTDEEALEQIDASMGGVFYIFVRWLESPAADGRPAGLYSDRPSAAFLRELERLTQGDEKLLAMTHHDLHAHFRQIRQKEAQA